jgi:glucan 1,3-beta-glucosidase
LSGSEFSVNCRRAATAETGWQRLVRASLIRLCHDSPFLSFLLPPIHPGFKMERRPSSEYQPNPSRSVTPDQPVFNEPLLPPTTTFLAPSEGPYTPRDSYLTSNSATNSAPLLPEGGEKVLPSGGDFPAGRSKPLHKKPLIWALAAAAIALIAVAVVVPVYFVVIKPKNNTVTGGSNSNGNNNGNGNDTPTHESPNNKISGGNGSTITTQDGSTFTYINPFGGICEWSSNFFIMCYF